MANCGGANDPKGKTSGSFNESSELASEAGADPNNRTVTGTEQTFTPIEIKKESDGGDERAFSSFEVQIGDGASGGIYGASHLGATRKELDPYFSTLAGGTSTDFIENCEKKEGDWLYTMLQAIVHLEPKWKSVYHYGGLMMDLCDNIHGSDALYEQGFAEFPEEGRFAFLLSTNASTHHDDVDKALYWMKKAAAVPNATPWYSAAVAGLIKKGDGLESSILYLEKQLETMPPSVLRDFTEERYRLLVHDSLVPKLEELRQKFIRATGREPVTVEELHIPVPDPYERKGGQWVLCKDGHVRSSIIESKEVRKAQGSEKELIRLAK